MPFLISGMLELLKPDGQGTIAGYDLRKQPAEVRRIIALTGQYAAVDELHTREENMHMMGKLSHQSSAVTRRRTDELLRQFD